MTPSSLAAPTPPKTAPSALPSAPLAPAQPPAPTKPQETLEGMQQMALGMYQLAEQELKNVSDVYLRGYASDGIITYLMLCLRSRS